VFILNKFRLPIPPNPIPAMLSLSLGEACPKDLPNTLFETIVSPATHNAELFKNFLLDKLTMVNLSLSLF
jgi:hypothetical protein